MDSYEANQSLKEIKDAEKRKNELISVAKQEIEEQKQAIEAAERRYEREIAEPKEKLDNYLSTVPYKTSKTEISFYLPNGKIFRKKEKQEMVPDKDSSILLNWVEQNAKDYVKTDKNVMWGEFKKDLVIEGEVVVRKSTGEVVEGVCIEDIPPVFNVKLTKGDSE